MGSFGGLSEWQEESLFGSGLICTSSSGDEVIDNLLGVSPGLEVGSILCDMGGLGSIG